MTGSDTLSSILFQLDWKSENADHTDCFMGNRVNFWRDYLPHHVGNTLMDRFAGETVTIELDPGKITNAADSKNIFSVKNRQFDRRHDPRTTTEPRNGRFFPKGILRDMTGIFRQNIEPFRVIDSGTEGIGVDFNHPLGNRKLTLSMNIQEVWEKQNERGGSSEDWMQVITQGPGMQVRYNGSPTDFFSDDPFARLDTEPDSIFYEQPRLVNHIDDTAIEQISGIYARFIKEDMDVLDLMSSWTSHIPEAARPKTLTGLGMNRQELKANRQLTDYRVHDLNKDPGLPFDSDAFDLVLCTVSIEYLTRPFDVFREVHRVLRPGGHFVVTFSNRWFEPKAIDIWKKIHEFERMGLVLEYFMESKKWEKLSTFSIRNLPRPVTDKYFPQFLFSDPVYCVWGQA